MAPLLARSRGFSGLGLSGVLTRRQYLKKLLRVNAPQRSTAAKRDEELAEGMRLFAAWTTAAPEEVQPETQHDRLLMAALLSTKERAAPSGARSRTVSCPDSLESIDAALMVLPAPPVWMVEAAKEMDPPNSLASTVSLPVGWDSLTSETSSIFNLFSDPVPSSLTPSLFSIDPTGVDTSSTSSLFVDPSEVSSTTSVTGSLAPETSAVSIPSTFFAPPRPVTSSTPSLFADPSWVSVLETFLKPRSATSSASSTSTAPIASMLVRRSASKCFDRFHACTEECFEVDDEAAKEMDPLTSSTSCADPSCVHRFHECTEECFEVKSATSSASNVFAETPETSAVSIPSTFFAPPPGTSSASAADPSRVRWRTAMFDGVCLCDSNTTCTSSVSVTSSASATSSTSATSSASSTSTTSSVDPSYIHRFHDCTEECFEVEAEVTHVCASSCFEFDPPGHTCDYACFRVGKTTSTDDVSDEEHTDATSSTSSLFPDPRSASTTGSSCTISSSSSSTSSSVCPDCGQVHEDASSSEDVDDDEEEVDENTDASGACPDCHRVHELPSEDEDASSSEDADEEEVDEDTEAGGTLSTYTISSLATSTIDVCVPELKTAASATTQTPVEQSSAARLLKECDEMLEKMAEMMHAQIAMRKRLAEMVEGERRG